MAPAHTSSGQINAADPGANGRDETMRFMMLMIPQVYQGGADADFRPDPEAIATMTAYNVRLGEAGVLVALEGLHPPSNGARVSFRNKTPVVTDGPFTETREVLGG